VGSHADGGESARPFKRRGDRSSPRIKNLVFFRTSDQARGPAEFNFILVLGALLLPLFGIFGEEEEGYGYGYEQTGYQTGYEQPSSGYNTFSKRSAEMLGPVLDALSTAYKKYEE
jgi:hypothetical protein